MMEEHICIQQQHMKRRGWGWNYLELYQDLRKNSPEGPFVYILFVSSFDNIHCPSCLQTSNSVSLRSFNSHRCHLPPGGGCRAAATATDTWIWWFCGEKMKFLCAWQAHCLSDLYIKGRKWRDSKKGNKHDRMSDHLGPQCIPTLTSVHLYLDFKKVEGFRSTDSMTVSAFLVFQRIMNRVPKEHEQRADPDLLLIVVWCISGF